MWSFVYYGNTFFPLRSKVPLVSSKAFFSWKIVQKMTCTHVYIYQSSHVAVIGQVTYKHWTPLALNLFLNGGGGIQISFISDQRKQQDQPTNSSVPETAYQSEWQNEKNWNNHIWEKVNTINMQQFNNWTIIKGVINWESTIPLIFWHN